MKRMETALFLLILFVVAPGIARAQSPPWSGILDPTRAIDWSTAGVIGGMQAAQTARTAICTTLGTAGQIPSYAQSVTVAQINSAITSCASAHTADAGGIVLLNPGTYSTGTSTITLASNVTLKGSGPTQTILNETGGGGAIVALGTGSPPAASTGTAITVDGTHNIQGSTSIVVASASNISVGKLLALKQLNLSYMTSTAADQGCGSGANDYCTGFGSALVGDSGQTVRVTSVSGTTIGISDPLYISYTSSPLAIPYAVSCLACGLESLHIYATNDGRDPNVQFSGAWNSWMYNVESDFADGAHTHIDWSGHNTFFGNFFHDGYSHGPGGEDDQFRLSYITSANLIENNIFWRMHVSIMWEWGASGNVVAYNYSTGNYDDSGTWFVSDFNDHGPHPMMNLLEGNISDVWRPDTTHGSSSHHTLFRDYIVGSQVLVPPKDARGALQTGSAQYESGGPDAAMDVDWGPGSAVPEGGTIYDNFVGVITGSNHLVTTLGAPSKIVAPTGSSAACIRVGYDSDEGSPVSPNQASTLLFQGTYNCKEGTFEWDNGTQALPASFFLNAKPNWFGSIPWPAIGPDVTGGNFTDWANTTATVQNGHVNIIPALACFNTSTANGTSNVTTFDASTCYTMTSTLVAPPTNLKAVAY